MEHHLGKAGLQVASACALRCAILVVGKGGRMAPDSTLSADNGAG